MGPVAFDLSSKCVKRRFDRGQSVSHLPVTTRHLHSRDMTVVKVFLLSSPFAMSLRNKGHGVTPGSVMGVTGQ